MLSRKYAADRLVTLVTTEWVLVEVADGLASRPLRSAFVQLMHRINTLPGTQIIHADHAMFDFATDLYAQRPDKDWSLTDCTSFLVMRRHGIVEALTADHHFEQAGFTALLK